MFSETPFPATTCRAKDSCPFVAYRERNSAYAFHVCKKGERQAFDPLGDWLEQFVILSSPQGDDTEHTHHPRDQT